jgi:hypothetical protein
VSAAICCALGRQVTEEREMRQASVSIQRGGANHLEDMTLAIVELGDPGACRRR